MKNGTALINKNLLEKIPATMAARWGVLPIEQTDGGAITVACANPDNLELLDNLQVLLKSPVFIEAWPEDQISKAIQDCYGVGAEAVAELKDDTPTATDGFDDMHVGDSAMVRFVNDLLHEAQRARATDIHIEPFEDELLIRFRVDGLLYAIPLPPTLRRFQPLLLSRIKVMAEMNIAEKRLPQDGRIRFKIRNDELDIRVSTIPTIHGESIDLRLLPRTRLHLGLEELGMSEDHRDVLRALIQKPNGIILVTGPTGHGKTTSLYACLSRINTVEKKIITIEDPVEVRLRGVNQIQVHSKIGLTFANGLRSVLRQDPDVIMVGEIRDLDTAEIAIRASLTGHLVFSTLHTQDAVGALTRLMDMGIEPYLVASSLHAIVAQRLVRTLCACKGNGCETCRFTGFHGRTGIFEVFLINDDIRQLMMERASIQTIREKAAHMGMRTMFQDGLRKCEAGLTTKEEILRVTEALE